MNKSNNAVPVIFLHIPKAGGTSLRRVIEKQYPFGTRYRIYHDTETPLKIFNNLKKEKRNKLQCVSGHFPFGIHKGLKHDFKYVSMLRNPVSRVIAQYNYIRTHPRNYLYSKVVVGGMSLKEFITSDISAELRNGQVRFISGVISEKLLSRFEDIDNSVLSLAKYNIEQYFSSVGILEYFDQSLLLMKDKMCWGDVYYARRNVSKMTGNTSVVSNDIIQLIEKHNEFDFELYEHVKMKQENELYMLGDKFEDFLLNYKVKNERYNKRFGTLESIRYKAEQAMTFVLNGYREIGR